MKYILTTLLIIFVLIVKSQVFDFEKYIFKGPIESVIEKTINNPIQIIKYNFDSLYRVKETKILHNENFLSLIQLDYIYNDSILIVKEKKYGKGNIHKSYFDSKNRIIRYEKYTSKDTTTPSIVEYNIVYKNMQIIEFYRITISKTYNDTTNEHFFIKYNLNNSIIEIIEKYCVHASFKKTLKYDKKNNLKRIIIEYFDNTILIGCYPWSKKERNKYVFEYKYDNYGNWIKKYNVTKCWKYKERIRIINYKKYIKI